MDPIREIQNPPGAWLRVAAVAVDLLAIDLAATTLFIAWALAQADGSDPVTSFLGLAILWLLVSLGYLGFFSAEGRQTIGYKFAAIQVLRPEPPDYRGRVKYLSISMAVWRAFWDLLHGMITYLFAAGYFLIAVTREKRSLPDFIAGASVRAVGKANVIGLVYIIGIELAAIFGLSYFVIEPYVIKAYVASSNSMAPLMKTGDCFFTNELYYHLNPVVDGDVVSLRLTKQNLKYVPSMASYQNAIYVKRVVGIPGQEIRIVGGHVYRRGTKSAIDEPYLDWNRIFQHEGYVIPNNPNPDGYWSEHPDLTIHEHDGLWIKIPYGTVFVLGDDRNNSFDSHIWGLLPKQDITGRVTCTYWPNFRSL